MRDSQTLNACGASCGHLTCGASVPRAGTLRLVATRTQSPSYSQQITIPRRAVRGQPILRRLGRQLRAQVPQLVEAGDVELLETLLECGHLPRGLAEADPESGLSPAYIAVACDQPAAHTRAFFGPRC